MDFVALLRTIPRTRFGVSSPVLDRLLASVISLMRSELELPFDEAFYIRTMEASHKKQAEYLEAFIHEVTPDFTAGSASQPQ